MALPGHCLSVHNKPQINPLETFTGRLLCARPSVGACVCLMELRCAIQTLTNTNPKPNPKPNANPNLEPNTNPHLTSTLSSLNSIPLTKTQP